MKFLQSHWVVLLGIAGSIASIIALWSTLSPNEQAPTQIKQDASIKGSNNIASNNQISNNQGNISIQNVYPDTKKEIRNFKKFIPNTYLSNLPRVKYNAYMEAHKYWDTGITSEMLKGTDVLYDKLRTILIDLADTAYTSDYFEGKTISDYYDERISRLMKASQDAQPMDGGTMHIVIAHGDLSDIVDDFIVRIVKDVSESSYFAIWKKKWDRAGELGSKGEVIDLDLTSEL
jgi:hypothetical protein